jgi:hypothetical protein
VVKRTLASALSAAVVLALPALALACPVCAGRSVANPYAQAALLGGFVFFPFAVVYTVVRYIRAGLQRVDAATPSTMGQEAAPNPRLLTTPADDGDRR